MKDVITPPDVFSLCKLLREYFNGGHSAYIYYEVEPHWLLIQVKILGGWGGYPPSFFRKRMGTKILFGGWELKNINMKREKYKKSPNSHFFVIL